MPTFYDFVAARLQAGVSFTLSDADIESRLNNASPAQLARWTSEYLQEEKERDALARTS